MSKKENKKEKAVQEETREETKAEETSQAAEEQQSPEEFLAALQKQLEEKQEKCDEYLDKCQRLAAEYDNFRKRTVKEREQIAVDSVADTIELLLPVMDNLDRAMQAIADEPDSSIKQGVEMVARQIQEAFDKIGIQKIPAQGVPFDPNLHNAVMHVEDDQLAESVVVEEFQTGYMYKEKVIRHSMVKVAN